MGSNFNIDDLYKNLEETFKVFGRLILDCNYQKNNLTISWHNYQSGITKSLYYAREYEELIKNRQFSFLLMDRSVIQIYYEFENEALTKYKLACYPYPVLTSENSSQLEDYYYDSYDETLCELYQNFLEEESLKLSNTSHLRFDYDCNVKTHAKSELQVGAINDIRVPFDVLIYPFVFIDFVVRNLFRKDQKYQEIAETKKYKDIFNFSKSRSVKIEEFQESNIHLTLPN